MFYEQFERLCKERNTTPTQFTKEVLNLSSSKVTMWKNGSIPKYEILNKIADAFNVSVGFLFDGDIISKECLSLQEKECLSKFNRLMDIDKGRILDRMETIYENYSHDEKEDVS